MHRLHALSTRASASTSAFAPSAPNQPHQRSQILSLSIFLDRHHHPNVSVMLLLQQAYPLPTPIPFNSQPSKPKGVTDPFNKTIGNRPFRDSTHHVEKMENPTNGSDHDIDSTTFGHMIPIIVDEEEEEERCGACSVSKDCGSDAESSGAHDPIPFLRQRLYELLQGASSCSTRLELMLLQDTTQALAMAKQKDGLSTENDNHKTYLRQFVTTSLRCSGYNAGICKTRWEKTNGYPAGDYEFIDVMVEGTSKAGNDRLFVDIDFRTQFEIARPTAEHDALVQMLPTLYVGTADKLLQVIKIMCDAARWSLKSKGMHIPPWRKFRYMKAKWMGSYKRITHLVTEQSHGRAPNDLNFCQEKVKSRTSPVGVLGSRGEQGKISGLTTALAETRHTRLHKA